MPALEKYKNFFNKSEEERSELYNEQSTTTLKKDSRVANYLGTDDKHLIAIIRNVLHIYDWAQHKETRDLELTEEEKILIDENIDLRKLQSSSTNMKTETSAMEISIEQPSEKVESTSMEFTLIHANIQTDDCKNTTNTELTSMEVTYTQTNKSEDGNDPEIEIEYLNMPRKRNFMEKDSDSSSAENEQDAVKLVLLNNECGVIDYGLASQIEEIVSKDQKNGKNNNSKKQKYYEDIYNSVWAPKGNFRLQESTSHYFFTIWDLPKEMRAGEIKNFLSYFGTASILAWQQYPKTKAAYIKIATNLEKRENSLRDNWSVQLNQGKTYRTTPGRFDSTMLEDRNKYKCTIYNVPRTALDSLLLRQLKKYNVQAVHTLCNRNGNQSGRAHIYFKSEEDRIQAQKTSLYYYNTKLAWQSTSNSFEGKDYTNAQLSYKKDNMHSYKGKRQLNETETGEEQNLDKKPRYTNTYRKPSKHNCENKENKPSSSTSFGTIVQQKRSLSVMNMNRKTESSNTYNTGKAKLAKREIPELQEFDINNTVPVSQPPIHINTKPRKKEGKERTKPQADNFTQHEALAEILKKLSKIEKDYESILLSGALAPNRS